jgi:hypothetical protein
MGGFYQREAVGPWSLRSRAIVIAVTGGRECQAVPQLAPLD